MMNNVKIAPSILSLDFKKLNEQIDILNQNFDYIHFDVMDGHFVPNITFGPKILKTFRELSNLFLDVHIMVSDPFFYSTKYIEAGADSITFHFEALNNDVNKSLKLINLIHSYNKKAGISIKPNTDVKLIEPLLKYADIVLIMSVEPGFGGQKFIDSALHKLKYLKEYKKNNNVNYIIEVDGGINVDTFKDVIDSGSELVVIGSYLFIGDIVRNLNTLKKINPF